MNFFEKIFYLLDKYGSYYLDGILMTLLLAVVGTLAGLILGCGLAILRNLEIKKNEHVVIKVLKKLGS